MKTLLTLAAVFVLTLAFAPPAEACCTPCDPWCKGAPDSMYCCTGIPEPGNACGLTTCGKWREMTGNDLAAATSLLMTPGVTSTCDDGLLAPEAEPLEPLESDAP